MIDGAPGAIQWAEGDVWTGRQEHALAWPRRGPVLSRWTGAGRGAGCPPCRTEPMAGVKRRAVLAAVLAVSLLGVRPGHALDLGLKPGQVYSLWANINACLLQFAEVVSKDMAWHERLAAMPVKSFPNKRSADVLAQVGLYRAKLDRLRHLSELTPTRRIPEEQAHITSSDVYLTSSEVLHAQVELLIRFTGPEQLVSQFYVRHRDDEKTPSQVFALVDLASRRLDLILANLSPENEPAE